VKLSVTLPDDDVALLDEYARASGLRPRSAALQYAIPLLRQSGLVKSPLSSVRLRERTPPLHEGAAACRWCRPLGRGPSTSHRPAVEGAIYHYRTGGAWRDLPAEFAPWQTVWKRHAKSSKDGASDLVLTVLLSQADDAGELDSPRPSRPGR
jgi:transposase